jgi:hypothetical protein
MKWFPRVIKTYGDVESYSELCLTSTIDGKYQLRVPGNEPPVGLAPEPVLPRWQSYSPSPAVQPVARCYIDWALARNIHEYAQRNWEKSRRTSNYTGDKQNEIRIWCLRDINVHIFLTNSMELSPSWEAGSCAATQEFPQHFMAPEVSLPCPQELTTGPYPEPDQSSPHHPIFLRYI